MFALSVVSFQAWCEKQSHSEHPKKKRTKKMTFNPRAVESHDPVLISDSPIEQVDSCNYYSIQMDNWLKWNAHVDFSCAKLSQRLRFLCNVSRVLLTFYNIVMGSLIRFGMVAWFGLYICSMYVTNSPGDIKFVLSYRTENRIWRWKHTLKPVTWKHWHRNTCILKNCKGIKTGFGNNNAEVKNRDIELYFSLVLTFLFWYGNHSS